MIEGEIPKPRTAAGAAPAAAPAAAAQPVAAPATNPLLMVGAGALGATALAVGAYFLFKK